MSQSGAEQEPLVTSHLSRPELRIGKQIVVEDDKGHPVETYVVAETTAPKGARLVTEGYLVPSTGLPTHSEADLSASYESDDPTKHMDKSWLPRPNSPDQS